MPGVIVLVLVLVLDGELVELVDDPLDVLGYLCTSTAFRRSHHWRERLRRKTSAAASPVHLM